MESEIIKKTFKLGNSAGVLLPIDWKDKKVKIQLIDKSITQDIFEILEERDLLKNVIGIFLAGSYAREEATESSDVDVLVITDTINKLMKIREYEFILVSKERFEKNIKKSLYLASLIKESRAIINEDFIKDYKNKVLDISLKKHLDEIKSITKINEDSINLDEELKKNVFDGTVYSIVLRLRELYLIDFLKNNKKYSNKEFLEVIKKVSGSSKAYDAYRRIKDDKPSKEVIKPIQARKLIEHIKIRLKAIENAKKK